MRSKFKYFVMLSCLALTGLTVTLTGCNCDDTGPPAALGVLATDQPSDSLIFDDVQLNKAQKKSFVLYNNGGQELTVGTLELVNDTGKVYKIINPPATPFTLSPGKDNGKKIEVEFLPTEAKAFTAKIRIASADANNVDENGDFFVNLRHNLLSPDPILECGGTINFASVEKGKSETKECVLKNRGNADLVITKADYEKEKGGEKVDFEWVAPSFPITVPADGKGVTIQIKYAPSDFPPREDQGAFIFESNVRVDRPEDRPRLKVVGMTAVALVELVPKYPDCTDDQACRRIDTRLRCTKDEFSGSNLCRQPDNQTPILKFPLTSKGKVTKRTFFIRSIGDRPLKVDGVSLEAASSKDFKVITTGVTFPLTLNPKEEKEITVEYAPSDEQEDTGQAIVASNAGNNPQAPVILEAASRGCNLQVQPLKVTFTGPDSKQVTIVNAGNESCVVNKVFIKSGKTDVFNLLPAPTPDQTLVPNGSFSFLVKFSPADKTKQNDFIVIESTDPDEPTIEVELEGEVIGTRPCELLASPLTLNYGLVPVGRSRKTSVTIANKGFGDCELTQLNVLGTNPAANTAFQLSSAVRTPVIIAAGSNIRLDISYTPPAERSGYEGKLEIQSNDTVQPNYEVKLVGSSGTLCLEVVPPNLDFGSTKFGCATPKRTIEIFNLGAAKCAASISVTGIQLAQNTNGEFRINSAPTVPRTLSAGQSIQIELSYKAKDLGVDTATLEIANSTPGQSPIPAPLVGEGVSTSDQKDVFKQLSQPLTDIMFVIDDSCSMSEEQSSMATNFQSFINWAVRLNVDYQIMVTTTDVTGAGGGAGCARGATKIVTNQTPNPTATFALNVNLGTSGSADEKGLEAAYRAMIPPALTGCNKGFYREPASLSMIFVSDEPDYSPQTVQFYVSFFKALKGIRNLDLIRASAVVGPLPSGCNNSGTGSAAAAPRYIEVSKQLKGVQESICNSNWAATLSNIGSITFGYRTQFFLSRQADPSTIVVKVNGQLIKEDAQDGWQYDTTNNSVNFSKSSIPAPNATVEVSYKAVCLP